MNYHNYARYGPTEPISNAFHTTPDHQDFPSSQGCAVPIPIDPAIISLPECDDADLQDPITILKAKGCKATEKTAGRRTAEKPYIRASHSPSRLAVSKKKTTRKPTSTAIKIESIVIDGEDEQQERRGHPVGTVNYADSDKREMLRLARLVVPLGGNSWQEIGRLYNEYAKHNRRPERPYKSLETKFKNVRSFMISNMYLSNFTYSW